MLRKLGFITNNVSLSINVNSISYYTWPEANRSLMPDDFKPRHIFLATNLVDLWKTARSHYILPIEQLKNVWSLMYSIVFVSCKMNKIYNLFNNFIGNSNYILIFLLYIIKVKSKK